MADVYPYPSGVYFDPKALPAGGEAGTEAPAEWAMVELFGHRRHFGRVTEVERFGIKMVRVDVPAAEESVFHTFFYPGASLFGLTPLTEAAARVAAERDRPIPFRPRAIAPPDERGAFDDADSPDEQLPF